MLFFDLVVASWVAGSSQVDKKVEKLDFEVPQKSGMRVLRYDKLLFCKQWFPVGKLLHDFKTNSQHIKMIMILLKCSHNVIHAKLHNNSWWVLITMHKFIGNSMML